MNLWIQQLIASNLSSGILQIPPPLLSHVFLELNAGMKHYDNAHKISTEPWYAHIITALLVVHWLLTPIVMYVWIANWIWSSTLTLAAVFSLWCINFVATEIEVPFRDDASGLPLKELQVLCHSFLL